MKPALKVTAIALTAAAFLGAGIAGGVALADSPLRSTREPTMEPAAEIESGSAPDTPPVELTNAEQHTVSLFEKAAPSVVFITRLNKSKMSMRPADVKSGTGSGLIWDTEGHVVTNHHVIAEGDSFGVIFPSETGAGAELAGLEVVKVDAQNDLALLRAPKLANKKLGLQINDAGVELGQRVAAMGYPFVAGSKDFTLTFEPGDVSAVKRVINEREFVQTNANINPGNSGGPVVDACGTVVGVVVATSAQAERVGLVVPVKRLVALRDAYRSKPPAAKKGISSSLGKLEKAVKYKRGKAAASLFSRGFIRNVVMPDFLKHIKRAEGREEDYAKVLKRRGVDYYRVDIETRMQFLKEELPRAEFEAWLIAQMLKLGKMGVYEAMTGYLSFWITDVFGDVQSLAVEDIGEVTDDTGRANVKIAVPKTQTFWEFGMVREWGDWRIEAAQCVRGC